MHRTNLSNNKLFLLLSAFYITVLMLIGSIACFFAYTQKKEEIFNQLNKTFLQLQREYTDIMDNFWKLYMPIFEDDDHAHSMLSYYFSLESTDGLTPLERQELSKIVQKMLIQDDRVQWIALYSDNRDTNYILFNTGTNLQALPGDFPYYDAMKKKLKQMELYGMYPINSNTATVKTFAICGSTPAYMGKGKILAGYSVLPFEQICQENRHPITSLSYQLNYNQELLFNSLDNYENGPISLPHETYQGIQYTDSKQRLFVNSKICANKDSLLSCQASWWEIFIASHQNTPAILLIVFTFALISFVIYAYMLHYISKEVNVIQHGLDYISANHLDYRITTKFKQSGLPEIANAVNQMTHRLQENINRAYHYEIKQKDAELAELQAKFNPHFLYNALEMIRSRCYQNQDIEAAELITQLSAIFRGFIGSKTFIPLQEELAFSKRYLSLFSAIYGDLVQIRYDFDTEVLAYGIIRNVFQPLIENYFVHGFDASSGDNNYIYFRGKSIDDKTMVLSVEDNGCGMSDLELEKLNAGLHLPVELSAESYGLKNLHQRLQLFYGKGSGLTITRNNEKGLCIKMTVFKLTCSEIDT